MLKLTGIKKDYASFDEPVHALKGVDIEFSENEFAAILGPSGCGKTTLLNIIGGLDRYTDGDLVINGKSTRTYRDRDWDAYRNHSVGFVFQSYNLIPHQTVLANVELALTLSGVSKAERKRRATEALTKVGLADQINKKPNQLSGGQMQRVAIARALVNDPEIILADEPTGALDSETSVQIMELLSEVARDRLVIMVTHNSELASTYATRIIRLLDGLVVSDDANAPKKSPKESGITDRAKRGENSRVSMSFLTALSLSLNNLMTKKGRTILTAFAGSIGIIGIALILSISDGFQHYIDRVQEDTLSNYPLTIEEDVMDLSAMFDRGEKDTRPEENREDGKIYSNGHISEGLELMNSKTRRNDLAAFREYLETDGSGIAEKSNGVQYRYSVDMFIYNQSSPYGTAQANPGIVYERMFGQSFSSMMSFSNREVFGEMIDNVPLLETQYDMLCGRWPENAFELVLKVDKYNQLGDFDLYTLGLRDQANLDGLMEKVMNGESVLEEQLVFTYEELLALKFMLLLPTDFYEEDGNGVWRDMRLDSDIDDIIAKAGVQLKIVGIIRPKEDAAATALNGTVFYTHALTEYAIGAINASPVVKAQKADPDTDVFTGYPFDMSKYSPTREDVLNYISTLPEETQAQILPYLDYMTDEELIARFRDAIMPEGTKNTYDGNLKTLGVNDLKKPSAIVIYPVDFESKDDIKALIDGYNDSAKALGEDWRVITYTDYVGLLMSSVSTIINVITYVLIAFVAVSLVVSSIMIGVITNISVLERTKEIGVLRSIGASKRDVSRVFNAETLIIGFISGIMGLLITELLTIPINALIYALGGIRNVAALPWKGALALLAISMLLTLVAGLIPSRSAAKKDPVVALRTE
ncbi:MAG: ABC transporter ATP-binding protein/permease [Clostridiales bacterium]|nr:ABC transporter ATP-binding protein/permease [Clostridiales bacterium]